VSQFFYLFTSAINLWHQKFITAVFVNSQHGIQRRRQDFDKKFIFEGAHSKDVDRRISEKSWTKCGVNKVLKSCSTQAQLTGGQAAADLAVPALRKTTVNTQIYSAYTVTCVEELKSVHLKCSLFAFSSLSAEYQQKI